MKVSVSLRGEDLSFLDAYAQAHRCPSRSAVVHRAIDALRAVDLHDAYVDAWEDWTASADAGLWDAATSDGL